MELLANILEFDYQYVLSEDNKFGSPEPNGTWNGLIKMLLEGVSDLGDRRTFKFSDIIKNLHNHSINKLF